ncbi:MAG: dihydroneopterin aldolase [Ferruginibacter sp.]|nr:dihydroneopterin aldolase [Ferruginibacter sp.]
MLTIHLHKLLFHSFHGYYEEEQILGNDFEVNADIVVDTIGQVTSLRQTVDYVTVYDIIKQRMFQATPLLETVAQELAQAIQTVDERIRSVSITINKLSPPVENFQGIVGVSYKTSA